MRTEHVWRYARSAVIGWLMLLAGCAGAIHGDWHLVSATPNRDVFGVDEASFRPDGTFAAKVTIDGVTTSDKGTYTFDGFRLKMQPQAGGQRSYLTQVRGDELQIGSEQRKAILRKGKRGA